MGPTTWNFEVEDITKVERRLVKTPTTAKMSHHSSQVSADLIWEIVRMLRLQNTAPELP